MFLTSLEMDKACPDTVFISFRDVTQFLKNDVTSEISLLKDREFTKPKSMVEIK